MGNSIHDSATIYKIFLQLKLEQRCRRVILRHIMTILISVFTIGYMGKTVQMEQASEKHRTSIAYFLNHGRWNEDILEQCVKAEVIRRIYEEAERTGKPIYCIVDDTISSKTKPSSRALHPIEDAYFHHSHLKKKKDYGHQAVGVMLSCNGIVLNYAIVMYDKPRSKIQIVCDMAKELPEVPVPSFFLCDCWYSCVKVMEAFLAKGFYTIGALKTNRVIFPAGIRQQVSQFAAYIHKTDRNVSLVTVGKRQYYVYRYSLGIRRFWVLMSTAHLISCMGTGHPLPFPIGFAAMQKRIAAERVSYIYHCGVSHVPLANVLSFALILCIPTVLLIYSIIL